MSALQTPLCEYLTANPEVAGHVEDAQVLVAIKQWFEQCTSHLDEITHEVFLEDRDFWEEVPGLVEALARRE